jgi:hypothetical protein
VLRYRLVRALNGKVKYRARGARDTVALDETAG